MKLANVVKMFNQTPYYDAYTGELLGKGQLDVYDDSKRDGLTAQRRVFEIDVNSPIPARMAISFADMQWLVGVKEIDQFRGKTIREKHVCHQAEGLSNYKSTLEALTPGAMGTNAYAARVWVKSSAQVEISSGKFNQIQVFFARAEPIKPNTIIKLVGSYYYVSEVYPAAAGHLVALSEEMEGNPYEVAAVTHEVYNPITEEYETSTRDVNVIKLRWQTDFEYFSQSTPDFERGDMQLAAAEALTAGTTVTLSEGKWLVKANQLRNGVYYHHIRRA